MGGSQEIERVVELMAVTSVMFGALPGTKEGGREREKDVYNQVNIQPCCS